MKMPTNYGVR